MDKIEISVVVPVYNGSETLKNLITEISGILKNNFKSYELILVDDESVDTSWEVITSLCKEFDWIKGINLRKNVGQHNCILAGLNFAKGDVIVTMDDDGQNSPKYITDLYKEITKGFDVCYANYKKKNDNFFKIFTSKANNLLATFLFQKSFDLHLTSFRSFNYKIKKEIMKNKSPFLNIDGLILSITSNISKIFVEHIKRKKGKSNYTFYKSLILWIHMTTSFSVAPLRFASILGLFFSFTGFLLTLWLVFIKVPVDETTRGWTSLMVAILFLGGVQLVALGAIGEYLGRAYLTVNNYPQFSVGKKINIADTK